MGIDFLEKTRKGFVKHIDHGRAQLSERTLFTAMPTEGDRSYIASLRSDVVLQAGETLVAQFHNGELHLLKGNVPVGKFDKVPPDVMRAIEATGGIANGVVKRLPRFSHKADVSLC